MRMNAFFGRSHSTTTSLIYDRSAYRQNRAVISLEARSRQASAVRDVPPHITQKESSESTNGATTAPAVAKASRVQRSEGGTLPVVRGLLNNSERSMPADGPAPQWQNDVIQYAGGCKITLIRSPEPVHYVLEMSKQSLGLTTRSASDNKRGHGLYVSEWTARFRTKTDSYKGLLCRLSFLQMVEIKLGLHNVISKAPVERCFRDFSIRAKFKDNLLRYDDIRDHMKKEVDDIFRKYEPGGIHYGDRRMVDILYDNKTRPAAHRTQNCVNMVRFVLDCLPAPILHFFRDETTPNTCFTLRPWDCSYLE